MNGKYKLTLTRKKNFVGWIISVPNLGTYVSKLETCVSKLGTYVSKLET